MLQAREGKLRGAGIAGRVQLAVQLKLMDQDVVELSRLLAVRTLQLEMEHIYGVLEEEVLDLGSDVKDIGMVMRQVGVRDHLDSQQITIGGSGLCHCS